MARACGSRGRDMSNGIDAGVVVKMAAMERNNRVPEDNSRVQAEPYPQWLKVSVRSRSRTSEVITFQHSP